MLLPTPETAWPFLRRQQGVRQARPQGSRSPVRVRSLARSPVLCVPLPPSLAVSTWGDCLYAPCTGEDTRAESLTVQDAGAPSVALAGQEVGAGRRRRFPEGPLCPCRPPALQEHFTRSDGMTDLVTTVTGAGKLSGGVFLVCLFSP